MYSGLLKTDSCCVQRVSKVSELFEKAGKHYVQRCSKVSELPEDDGADGQKAEKNDNTPVQRDSKVSELDLAAGVLPGLPVFPVFPYRTVIRSTWRKMPGEGYRFFFRADFTGKLHFRDFAEDFA